MPYFKAEIRVGREKSAIDYFSARGDLVFNARYEPGENVVAAAGSFETWATERYCLYSQSKDGALYRADVHHMRWPLQKAALDIRHNTLCTLKLGALHPSVLYSQHLDVVFWSPERVG